MKIKIKIKKELDEISTSGAVAGYAAPLGSPKDVESFNRDEAEKQRLKGHKVTEMMSTSGGKDVARAFSIKDEEGAWQGHRERARMQGNRAMISLRKSWSKMASSRSRKMKKESFLAEGCSVVSMKLCRLRMIILVRLK